MTAVFVSILRFNITVILFELNKTTALLFVTLFRECKLVLVIHVI